ncbi:hypothetical protein M8J77_022262 [Diaphorina citri]|nr:hypothetical protein M8J77_022262 [Diaphorina citri]
MLHAAWSYKPLAQQVAKGFKFKYRYNSFYKEPKHVPIMDRLQRRINEIQSNWQKRIESRHRQRSIQSNFINGDLNNDVEIAFPSAYQTTDLRSKSLQIVKHERREMDMSREMTNVHFSSGDFYFQCMHRLTISNSNTYVILRSMKVHNQDSNF